MPEVIDFNRKRATRLTARVKTFYYKALRPSFGHTGPDRTPLFNIGRIGARQSADRHFGAVQDGKSCRRAEKGVAIMLRNFADIRLKYLKYVIFFAAAVARSLLNGSRELSARVARG